jgi:hypothetical protein
MTARCVRAGQRTARFSGRKDASGALEELLGGAPGRGLLDSLLEGAGLGEAPGD